jgi:hypothetical protein
VLWQKCGNGTELADLLLPVGNAEVIMAQTAVAVVEKVWRWRTGQEMADSRRRQALDKFSQFLDTIGKTLDKCLHLCYDDCRTA